MVTVMANASAQSSKRPKIAAHVSEYRKYSHGQNIVDRFLGGYGWESCWHRPDMDVVALYVDQFPEADLSREREARYADLKIYATIAEALTLGGGELAVDGVLLIAEHGQYEQNAMIFFSKSLRSFVQVDAACRCFVTSIFRGNGIGLLRWLRPVVNWTFH